MLEEGVVRATEQKVGAARSFGRRTGLIVLILALGVLALKPLIASAAQPPVDLRTADSYAVLAGQGVTNTGPTVIHGDLGTSPNPAVTGFPPGKVKGAVHKADAAALQAKKDLTKAYNDAAGRTPVTTIGTQLGGKTLKPGVYDSNSGTFQITGTLTLDAQGDPDGVFIFQMAATLVSASNSNVRLIGAAQPCNVFWQVGSSATLGTNSTFTGNILALTSIQVQTNVTVQGRVLARNASVTLDTDTITVATCSTSPTSTPPPTSQVTPVPSGGVQTGGGSTAGLQDVALLVFGGALLAAAAGTFAMRRRSMRHD
jgi:Ice-binding-like